ncbi:glycosyltransferase [Roseomonas sp. CCTCC AB2023176]|uniref:glycosyltransferase n=1 Tax=Roseomonas sp. CCTCC AB2023176 TaxID=3342640 RepID=UPI0035D7C96E
MTADAQDATPDWQAALQRGDRARRDGDLPAALLAYREAASLAPAEPHPPLHGGHVLRLLGRTDEALRAYDLAISLDPFSRAARDALAALRSGGDVPVVVASQSAPDTPRNDPEQPRAPVAVAPPPPAQTHRDATTAAGPPVARTRRAIMRAGSAGSVAYDVSDLLLHLAQTPIPTGIQRVVAGVTRAAIRRGGDRARIVTLDEHDGTWRRVASAPFAAVLDLLGTGDDEAWEGASDELRASLARAEAVDFAAGDALVSLGSPWGIPGHLRAVRRSGARWVPFLHDCAPLDRPEHCVRGLVQAYARWFGGIALCASGLICNSEATRAAGEAHLDALAPGLNLPTGVARLDADPRPGSVPDRKAARRLLGAHADEPYVLFVGTIESRKDHLTVLRAWLSLRRRRGPGRLPRLVLVGGPGWHAEAAMGLLSNSEELAAAVQVLHGVPDAALAALYAGCLFTVYNSHLEGWGLPVTESLAWGKVPVVADLPALRESGGAAAILVPPQDEAALADTVERLLRPGELATREAALGVSPLRRWDDVEVEIAGLAAAAAAGPAIPRQARGTLPPAERLSFLRNDTGRPMPAAAFAESLRDDGDWLPLTELGAPFRGPVTLRIPLGGTLPGGAARLGLEVSVPEGTTLSLEVLPDGEPAGRFRIAPSAAGDGAVSLGFDMPAAVEELGLRLWTTPPGAAATLRGLMLCREDDLLARVGFVEAQAGVRMHAPVGGRLTIA